MYLFFESDLNLMQSINISMLCVSCHYLLVRPILSYIRILVDELLQKSILNPFRIFFLMREALFL